MPPGIWARARMKNLPCVPAYKASMPAPDSFRKDRRDIILFPLIRKFTLLCGYFMPSVILHSFCFEGKIFFDCPFISSNSA